MSEPSADPYATRPPADNASTTLSAPSVPAAPLRNDRPCVPGYEVLQELGRGGMGVVYLAQQTRLQRLVALKMIRAGDLAGSEERNRFRTEAEAIARLQHPHIVQVHEVGEHEGRPFFSLEFCAGGSLDRKLAGTPLPPREAAQLLETLARAMHAAHEAHVIHRDLKPANVLLTEDGTPKISDFGLAKKLDEAGATATGAIMGTPSYMAPEQASGVSTQTGPLTDVYALGAILYECLTGRPPFKAATPLETVLQVQRDEPVPPSRLNRDTPRDLETICLKCLQKQPARRYGSALELAADLRRFLDGEPIHARPVGRLERAVKWARRRPAQATLLAVSAAALLVLLGGLAWHQSQLADKNRELTDALDGTEKQRQRNVQLLRVALYVIEEQGDFANQRLQSLPHTDLVRQELLRRRLRYYEPILKQEPGDPEMRQTQGVAYLGLGIIYQQLGQYPKAEEAYRQALVRFERSAAEDPTPAHRYDLARALVQFGTLWKALPPDQKAEAEAEESLWRGHRMLEQLVKEHPEPAYQHALGKAGNNLALFLDNRGRFEVARELHEQVIRLRQQLAKDHPEEDRFRWDLVVSHNNLGGLWLGQYKQTEAEKPAAKARQSFEDAQAVLRELAPRYRDSVEYRHMRAGISLNLGILNQKKAPQKALEFYRQALSLWKKLHDDFPEWPEYTQKTVDAYLFLGQQLQAARELPPARDALRQALALSEEWEHRTPKDPTAQNRVNQALYYLALVLRDSGEWEEEERWLQQYAERLRQRLARSPDAAAHRDLALVLGKLADLYKKKGEILKFLPPLGLAAQPHHLGLAIHDLTRVYAWQGFLGQAADYYAECLEQTRRAARADDRCYDDLGSQAVSLASIAHLLASYRDMRRAAEAAEESARKGKMARSDGGKRYVFAALLQASCSTLADKHLPPPERDKRAQAHAEQSLQLLTLAVQAGYHDAAMLEKARELDPVRRHCAADFAKLLAGVKAKK